MRYPEHLFLPISNERGSLFLPIAIRTMRQYATRCVALHRPTRSVAALLALTAVRPRRTAHIPQVAVAREFQGMGLGTALMERAFTRLAAKGFQEVSLTVTDLNAGAVRLYERLGFTTFQTFGAFVWNRPD